MKRLLTAVLISMCLAACQESPEETAEDVADARAEGAEEIREAEADRREVQREAQSDISSANAAMKNTRNEYSGEIADSEYEVEIARAKATLDTEQEKCEAHTGNLRDTCKEQAEAVYDRAVADAELRRAQRARANEQNQLNNPSSPNN